ncbi:MAG: MFS transporter, partial [Firmicutes bacterium]|nr:MFS transporter [Bacillota bacterium]
MATSFWKSGPLAEARFRTFYWGFTVAQLGSAMTPVALAFAVMQSAHGDMLLGYVLACQLVPHVLLALLGGAFADRFRKDRILLVANLGSCATQAGIAIVVLTHAASDWLFPFALASGVVSALSSPALRGLIPEVVEPQQIKAANSLVATSRSASRVAGPLMAGVLVATVGGGWGIATDAVTFAIAAAFMARLQLQAAAGRGQSSIWPEIREGWSYFRGKRWIWMMTAAFTGMNLIQMGVWQVLGPIIALHTFGSVDWGLIVSAKSIGLLAAGAVLVRVFP